MLRPTQKNGTAGFTMVEIVFTIVIIAILAVGILLLYNNMREKARDSERLVDLQTINSAMRQMYGDENRYKSPDEVAAYLIEKKFINLIPTDPYPYKQSAGLPNPVKNIFPRAYAASKQTVCHNGKSLSISQSAVSAHLGHGDSLGECPAVDDGTQCLSLGNMTFYNALSPDASGKYPAMGTESDQATVTSSNPISAGTLSFDLVFNNVPANFENASLKMDFVDLDLHGDTLNSGSKRLTLFEAFELRDVEGNLLASLDENSSQDDSFSWSTSIPNELLQSSSVTLQAEVTSLVTLTKGSSLTITNSDEGINNIKLCGQIGEEDAGGGEVPPSEVSTICHLDSVLETEETIDVPSEELGLHFAHNDYLGVCDGRTDWSEEETETVCHVLDAEPNTIEISSSAVAEHLAHGDYAGECEEAGWEDDYDDEDGESVGDESEVTFFDICHVSAEGEINLTVVQSSVQAHLAHGDYKGNCDGRTIGGDFDEWQPDCDNQLCGIYHYVYGVGDDSTSGDYGQYFEVSARFESNKNSKSLVGDKGNDDDRFEIGIGTDMINTHFLDPNGLPAGQNMFEGEIIGAKALSGE